MFFGLVLATFVAFGSLGAMLYWAKMPLSWMLVVFAMAVGAWFVGFALGASSL